MALTIQECLKDMRDTAVKGADSQWNDVHTGLRKRAKEFSMNFYDNIMGFQEMTYMKSKEREIGQTKKPGHQKSQSWCPGKYEHKKSTDPRAQTAQKSVLRVRRQGLEPWTP